MRKDLYVFPAIFDFADDGINVSFPDLPGAFTCGDTEEEAIFMAKDCLELHLYGLEEDKEIIPEPSKIKDIELEKNQAIIMTKVNLRPVREEMKNKTIKKTLTIPKWLNDVALKSKVNFSAILKEALIKELEIKDI